MQRSSWLLAGLMVSAIICHVQAEPPSHASAFSDEGLLKAKFSELKNTTLAVHPDVALEPGKNVLWCGTFQLCWNEAIGLVGEKLHFENQPPIVNLLNQEDFTKADLNPASYVAIADFEKNHVEDEIRAALEKTFGGAASPELIPPVPAHPLPEDFLAYAYLFKNLGFEHPFQDGKPIDFENTPVKNFSLGEAKGEALWKMKGQVSICFYESDDNFVAKLKTILPDDELILAKIPMPSNLRAGIADVVTKAANREPERMGPQDTIAVPKLNFDLRGDVSGLAGLVLNPGPNARIKNLIIAKAEQLIRFQLNENGAVLKSEAAIMFAGSMARPNPPKHLVFDRPFLILMKQAKSDKPYFALWVGNASLLVPAK